PAQHLVIAEPGLRVLLVGIAQETGVRKKSARSPFPDVADHLAQAEGGISGRMVVHARGGGAVEIGRTPGLGAVSVRRGAPPSVRSCASSLAPPGPRPGASSSPPPSSARACGSRPPPRTRGTPR